MARNILVTGGGGFIGSHLVRELLNRGHEVHILDNFLTGRRQNIQDLINDVEVHEIDLRDQDAVRKTMQNKDWVFHQGALPSVPRSIEEPRETHEVNINGTLNVLLGARSAAVEAVVMASSSSVYGDTPTLPKHEDFPPSPLSPYAFQKLTMEHMGQVYARCYGMRIISLRYFNVFGPRQDPLSAYAAVVPSFVMDCLAGQAPVIYGDGEQTRDFTYVENVVLANIAAAERGKGGLVANIAGGQARSVTDLALAIAKIVGVPELKPKYVELRAGDVKHSLADVERASKELGFDTKVSFEQGLQRTVSWYRENS
jgi:nucleoside-diphosphate-sugar epimerase